MLLNPIARIEGVHGPNHPHQLNQLRFLRYRKEVISSWRASEEKRILLRSIESQIDLCAALCSSSPSQTICCHPDHHERAHAFKA
jgi:hypothetical protein